MTRTTKPYLQALPELSEPGRGRLTVFDRLVWERPEEAHSLLSKIISVEELGSADPGANREELSYEDRLRTAAGALLANFDDLDADADSHTTEKVRAESQAIVAATAEGGPSRDRRVARLAVYAGEVAAYGVHIGEAAPGPEMPPESRTPVTHSVPEAA